MYVVGCFYRAKIDLIGYRRRVITSTTIVIERGKQGNKIKKGVGVGFSHE